MAPDAPFCVLLVEDNPSDVHLLRSLLGRQVTPRFEVVHFETVAEALDYLGIVEQLPDVALLDLMLPDAEGLEVFTAFLQSEPDLPLVVLTGSTNEALGIKAVQMGVQDYLVKDKLTDDVLVRALRYAAERHRLQRQSDAAHLRDRELGLLGGYAERLALRFENHPLYGTTTLRESAPESFILFQERYGSILDDALDALTTGDSDDTSGALRELAADLTFARAGARDLTDLHAAALQERVEGAPAALAAQYFKEGRFLLIELMGHVILQFRRFALGQSRSF